MIRPLPLAVTAALLLALPAASAQTTVNPRALDALQPSSEPAPTRRAPAHAAPASTHGVRHAEPAKPAAAPAKPAAQPASVPASAPPPVEIPPPVTVPVQRTPPPPVVPVNPNGHGVASPLPGDGLRITFDPNSSELDPATDAALRSFARAVKADDRLGINVAAYASGDADDQSTPRRLSLSRALAVRAVLINEGIVSTRIYPRALGAPPAQTAATTPGSGAAPPPPADRADVTRATSPASSAAHP